MKKNEDNSFSKQNNSSPDETIITALNDACHVIDDVCKILDEICKDYSLFDSTTKEIITTNFKDDYNLNIDENTTNKKAVTNFDNSNITTDEEKVTDLNGDYKDDYLSDISNITTEEEKLPDLDGDYKDNYLSDIR